MVNINRLAKDAYKAWYAEYVRLPMTEPQTDAEWDAQDAIMERVERAAKVRNAMEKATN